MNLPENAPVKHTQSITIAASIDTVWRLMSGIDRWPEWNPEIKSAKLFGALEPGNEFAWKAGPGTIRSTIEAVSPQHLIGWRGSLLGIRAVHIWRIEGEDGAVVVTTEESWSGLIPRIFRRYSEKTLENAISHGLSTLKKAAENLT